MIAAALTFALLAALTLSLFVGAGHTTSTSIWYSRLPRGVLAALVGAGLAVAGAIMQQISRNPLASPQTMGVNTCAALAMVISIVVGSRPFASAAFGGSLPALLGAALGGAA